MNAFDIVERKFFPEVIIDHGIGELRPAVDQVPPQDAAALRIEPGGLDHEFQGFRLKDLTGFDVLLQRRRFQTEIFPELSADQSTASGHVTVFAEGIG